MSKEKLPGIMGAAEVALTLGVMQSNVRTVSGLPAPLPADVRATSIRLAADVHRLAAKRADKGTNGKLRDQVTPQTCVATRGHQFTPDTALCSRCGKPREQAIGDGDPYMSDELHVHTDDDFERLKALVGDG